MNEVLNRVKENYHLNNLELSHKVELGYLSDNYVLINGDKKYFLKKHRVADPIKVRQILDIEQLFFDRGIPAILPITFADNQTMFQVEDSVYSLYPFVEGSHGKGKHYSKTALKSAGEMLAKIHVAGQKDYPKIDYDDFVMWAKPDFLAKAKFLRELIKSDSEFDNMARDFLDLKVKIVEETETFPYENNFGEPQLIHGDFHGSNLFFNDKDEITHVFDFEKAQIQPPVLEIVRSMNFLCFGEDFGEYQFENAEHFLKCYRAFVPFDIVHFRNALWFWHFREVYSLWLHSEHYQNNNTRVDNLYEKRYGYLKYYSENIKTHVEKVMNRIT